MLLEHPAIARAAVVGLPDALMGEVPVAAVELHPDASLDDAELLDWLGPRLAPYQRPRADHRMALPTSADLKVKRRLVRDLLAAG